ncbi:MAG: hypothetical protein ACE14V_04835 [bacterium]
MRKPYKVLFLLSILLAFSGCIVASLNPLYDSDKELVSNPALVGTWASDDKETFTFVENGQNQYECTITSDSISNNFDVHLVKLGKYQFLDLYPKELDEKQMAMNLYYRMHTVPVHSFSKISIKNDRLYVSMLNLDWTKKLIEQKKIKIPYTESNGIIVLTGPSKQLQKFVLQYADDTEAFEIPTDGMKRIK